MPIPAKFNDKMVKIMNPHEEVANDVINRLNFLFEVKPSRSYQSVVSKQFKVVNRNDGSYEFDFNEEEDNRQHSISE